jgi:hypothetical protein
MKSFIPVILFILLVGAVPARAQSFEAGVHFASAKWSEFDGNDLGVGGRISWLPMPIIGVDADLTFYPGEFPPDTAVPFSGRRFEGLFGVTIGPRIAAVRPFGKVSAGFLQVGDTPIAFACIAIYPPPLSCALAGGDTLAAYEIGGGVEVNTSSMTFIRADISDRILSYPGPVLRSDFTRSDEGFLGHAIRFTVGGGLRF